MIVLLKCFVHRFFLFSIIFFVGSSLYAQLVTSPQTPVNLVQNTLLGGGVQISNINYYGSVGAIGYFNGNNTNLGLQSGIIITTGVINSNTTGPLGPNNMPGAGVDLSRPGPPAPVSGWVSSQIGTSALYDAAVLSFDFIPQGTEVSFRYVFGSEEYNEYVDSEFNDAFGFFIQGPGIPGGYQNMAKIPGTNDPVSINSVNNGFSNGCSTGGGVNSAYFVDNCNGPTVQYDGFTRVLTAKSTVIPCSTYRFYIVITDVGDGLWDSGVFLEEKSFTTNSNSVVATINSIIPGDPNLYEGCGTATLTFTRTGNTSVSQTLGYTITGTATNGVDYNMLPGSVTFAPGETQVDVTVTPVADGIVEGDETLIVTLVDDNPCPAMNPPSVTITIKDYEEPTLQAPPDIYNGCNREKSVLEAIVTGLGNSVISWDNGVGTGNPVTVYPEVTTTYTVTLRDLCQGTILTDEVTVHIPQYDPLELITSRDTSICGGEPVTLFALHSGGIGVRYMEWSTGDTTSTITVAPKQTTAYNVFVTDSCGNMVEKKVMVYVQSPSAAFTYRYRENDRLLFIDGSSHDVVEWIWDFGDGGTSTEQNPEHKFRDTGLFKVTLIVRNVYGCYDTVSSWVRSYPPFKFFIPNAFTPNGDDFNNYFDGKGEGFIGYEMQIFNRWGEEIYDSKVYGRGWPGIYKGKEVQIGVYVYKFVLTTPVGIEYRYQGHVTLLR